ncbi:MAG: bifunctional phosphopantothenoylcysteine decarboxylase/phosphopantothenate--cysteine ligase CoaBC [Acidimicrobiia bacterium]
MFAGRHIVLGVSGGVAAYKAAYLARRLIEHGAEVRVVMTSSATHFVGQTTFAAITGSQPVVDLFGQQDVSPHTTLARWADAMVIAPATAATMARIASGQSSDALSATVLATTAPLVIAPAMHTEMWEHPATQDNVATLRSFGYAIVDPEVGSLAGGDTGIGRLAEPEAILDVLSSILPASPSQDMLGLTVVITAGGTREAIDPVRYIGNRSSGKMGNALAATAAKRGATVFLVTAAATPIDERITAIEVESAREMADAVWGLASKCDIAVMAAAVADFRPSSVHDSKLKRDSGTPDISLERTPDVLAGVVAMDDRPFVVGFAAETGSLDDAVAKATRKGVDLLVANDVAKPGSGFGSDTNEITLIDPAGNMTALALMRKTEAAEAIWSAVLDLRD